MRKHIPFFLNNLTVWVLVAILTGCGGGEDGGSDQNQSATQKPDNAKGGQAAKGPETPKAAEKPAEKFTPEMVKAAMEAALKQLPNLRTTKEERVRMMEPTKIKEFVDILNKQIVNGKVNDPAVKIDAITVEALTEALVTHLPRAKKMEEIHKSTNNAGHLVDCLLDYSLDVTTGFFQNSDNWCDAILREARTMAVFYSPQHPDTPKLKETLPKPATTEPTEPAAPTEPPAPGQEKPKPLPKGKRVSHYAMNKAMSGKVSTDPEVVLVFECDLGWNGAGGLEDALKYMDKLKLEKIAVAKVGGSAHSVTKEELKKLKWVPEE